MTRVRVVALATIGLGGLGITLTGLAVRPHSNPEAVVQVAVWGLIMGGVALMIAAVALALLWKSP